MKLIDPPVYSNWSCSTTTCRHRQFGVLHLRPIATTNNAIRFTNCRLIGDSESEISFQIVGTKAARPVLAFLMKNIKVPLHTNGPNPLERILSNGDALEQLSKIAKNLLGNTHSGQVGRIVWLRSYMKMAGTQIRWIKFCGRSTICNFLKKTIRSVNWTPAKVFSDFETNVVQPSISGHIT